MNPPDLHRSPSRLGDFVIVGVLGEGGSGTVYDARWGHREVALKVLRGEIGEGDRERFLAEARLLMEITHPGVVKVLAAGTLPDGQPYLAMEKLPGESLARRLGRAPLPLDRAVTLFAQLCDAVAAMHARSLIHRDLKPENVMLVVGPTGEHAVLLDFGIAKVATEGVAAPTNTGIVRGTPAYMAPERFFGHPAAVATDVYELAVTLFAMITGRLPWADVADPEVRLNATRLSAVAAVPPALDELVARALSTRPGNRPASVAELRAEVIAAAGTAGSGGRATAPLSAPVLAALEHASTRSAASGERAVVTLRTRRRWPWVAVALGALAAGAAAVIVASRGEPAARRLVTGPDDPWSGEGPSPVLAVDAGTDDAPPPLPPAERDGARAALAASIRHHAPDVLGLVGIAVAEARRTPELAEAFRVVRTQLVFRTIVEQLLGACELPFAERATWMSLAILEQAAAFDLVASGAWTRDEIEQCVGGADGKVQRAGAEGALSVVTPAEGGPRVIGWIDDTTFFVSSRTGADQRFVAARLTRPRGKPPRVLELADGIDRRATLWLVAGRESLGRVTMPAALAAGELTARFALGEEDPDGEPGAAFQVAMYFADEAAAKAGEAAMQTSLAELTDSELFDWAVPEFKGPRRDGTMVRIYGILPMGLVGKLQGTVAEALP